MTHIIINTQPGASRLAAPLRQLITNTQVVSDASKALAAIMQQCVKDNGNGTSDYSDVETQFGIVPFKDSQGAVLTDTASAGYAVLYQLNQLVSAISAASVQQLLAQLG